MLPDILRANVLKVVGSPPMNLVSPVALQPTVGYHAVLSGHSAWSSSREVGTPRETFGNRGLIGTSNQPQMVAGGQSFAQPQGPGPIFVAGRQYRQQ